MARILSGADREHAARQPSAGKSPWRAEWPAELETAPGINDLQKGGSRLECPTSQPSVRRVSAKGDASSRDRPSEERSFLLGSDMLGKASWCRAFTLLELLVVVAIVALLLAMLMPALGQAQRSSQEVICGQRLRQWGTAFACYARPSTSASGLTATGWIATQLTRPRRPKTRPTGAAG